MSHSLSSHVRRDVTGSHGGNEFGNIMLIKSKEDSNAITLRLKYYWEQSHLCNTGETIWI